MPSSWHTGSWLLYFLIQVNYLIAFEFNLALGNSAVRDEDLICIPFLSGKMTFHFDEEKNHGTLTMTLSGGTFTYYLTVVLRTTPLKSWKRQSPSQEVCISQVSRLGITQIPPIPAHPPSDLRIVPSSVLFCIPCPCCQYPLERGEYCTSHCAEGLTVLQGGRRGVDGWTPHPPPYSTKSSSEFPLRFQNFGLYYSLFILYTWD